MSLSVELSTVPDINFSKISLPDLDNGYDAYKERGGIYSRADWEGCLAIEDSLPRTEFPSSGEMQASLIAAKANIELTRREVLAYCRLRTKAKVEGTQDTNTAQPDVHQLYDQLLLHQILLAEGEEYKVKRLEATHPHIFGRV